MAGLGRKVGSNGGRLLLCSIELLGLESPPRATRRGDGTACSSGSGLTDVDSYAFWEHGPCVPGRQTSDVENNTPRQEWAPRPGWARD